MRTTVRSLLTLLLVGALVACSVTTDRVPTLRDAAGGLDELSAFVSLADALALDLDAIEGNVTVFAPSNALLDAYADALGFDGASDLLGQVGTLDDLTFYALRSFVMAHSVYYPDGPMTADFLSDGIVDLVQDKGDSDRYFYYGGEWVSYNAPAVSGREPPEYTFHHADVFYVEAFGGYEADSLYLYFEGYASDGSSATAVSFELSQLGFAHSDVVFDKGIVHTVDAVIE